MKKILINLIVFILTLALALGSLTFKGIAEKPQIDLKLDCLSAVLMEAQSGQVLYALNQDQALPPASVTKVMTLLLIMEAIEEKRISLTDMVSASEHACSMGGSQIYLEPGEQMSVEDLLKSVIIASANDAAVTLAEYVAGTEEAFVDLMNKKAQTLGMKNTNFENTNGLDDTTKNHVTSALDIAIMSRELIKYPKVTEYSKIWMDTIRNGEFGLTNTNRLVRFYKGATGLKTGSTSKAGFCITATAERDGMTLISVIMGSSSRDARNNSAVSLLNYGFSNYTVFNSDLDVNENITVIKGQKSNCRIKEEEFIAIIPKNTVGKVEKTINMGQSISAPVFEGQQVGTVIYSIDGKEIGQSKIVATEGVKKAGFLDLLLKILSKTFIK